MKYWSDSFHDKTSFKQSQTCHRNKRCLTQNPFMKGEYSKTDKLLVRWQWFWMFYNKRNNMNHVLEFWFYNIRVVLNKLTLFSWWRHHIYFLILLSFPSFYFIGGNVLLFLSLKNIFLSRDSNPVLLFSKSKPWTA